MFTVNQSRSEIQINPKYRATVSAGFLDIWLLKPCIQGAYKARTGSHCQNVSVSMNVLWNIMKAFINKWKKWGTTLTTKNRTSQQNWLNDKMKSYQRGCQETCANRSCRNIWQILLTLCIGQWALIFYTSLACLFSQGKKNIHSLLQFAKTYIQSPRTMSQNLLWSVEAKTELCWHNSKRYIWCKNKTAYHQNHPIARVKHGGSASSLA